MSVTDAALNIGRKIVRRIGALHKPMLRRTRRRARAHEERDMLERAIAVEGTIATAVAGDTPVIVGPWLAEVGYEALYWLAFLRWVEDRFRLSPQRVVALSRGGVEHWYGDIAARYVDIFDIMTPAALASRNDARQQEHEAGGRKQSAFTDLDEELLAAARRQVGAPDATVLHPSLLFGLFRDVWQGRLPADFMFVRTAFRRMPRPPRPAIPDLPAKYVAVKLYTGTALPDSPEARELLRELVRTVAAECPVVLLETGRSFDEHADYPFDGMAGVISARPWMTPRTNLGVQTALVANAQWFLSTCGGLAWLAPFLDVPTVAVYADDRQLGPHILAARQAGRRVGAAELNLMDLRGLARLEHSRKLQPQMRLE